MVQAAEAAGFDAAMCSDHWAPWSDEQGESGFAWSWLGAALQATTSLPFGVVNAPGQRYHPAIVAQAAATLDVMYPGPLLDRHRSGQLLNEHITGERWPAKAERNERLREAAEIMRALWAGETVVAATGHVTISEAKLWTRPRAAAARRRRRHAGDRRVGRGVGGRDDHRRPGRRAARRGGRGFRSNGGAGKPMYLQVHLAYAPTDE